MANPAAIMQSTFAVGDNHKRHSPSLLSTVSIPGVHRLTNSSRLTKTVWSIAISVCTGLCFHQLFLRIQSFLECPVTLDVIVIRNQTIMFPSVTLCPANLHYAIHKSNPNRLNMTKTFNESVIAELWKLGSFDLNNISVTAPCLTSVKDIDDCNSIDEHIPLVMQPLQFVDTLWGTCVTLTTKSSIEYRGPYTLISVTLPTNKQHTGNITYFRFYLHSNTIGPYLRHDSFFLADSVKIHHRTEVRIGMKEFSFLNRSSSPCIDELTLLEKRNQCIDKKMEEALKCRLPLFNSTKLKFCTNFTELKKAYYEAFKIYTDLSTDDCSFERKCRDFLISISVHDDEDYGNSSQKTELVFYYADNLHEIYRERCSYSFSALVSDIGGSLGFYLGVSVLAVLEIIEGLVAKFCAR